MLLSIPSGLLQGRFPSLNLDTVLAVDCSALNVTLKSSTQHPLAGSGEMKFTLENFLLYFLIAIFLHFDIIYCNTTESWKIGFHDSATPIMEGINNLHQDLVCFCL